MDLDGVRLHPDRRLHLVVLGDVAQRARGEPLRLVLPRERWADWLACYADDVDYFMPSWDDDDTLTTDGAITPDALQALHDLHAAGVVVIPVTGRPIGWCQRFMDGLSQEPWPVPAMVAAADKIIAKGKKIAAHLLEASDTDIEFDNGEFKVKGTDKKVPFGNVALTAYVPHNYPLDKLEPGNRYHVEFSFSLDNNQLRDRLAEREVENRDLKYKVEETRARIENLLARLPEGTQ